MAKIPAGTTLAAADDVNGDPTNTATWLDLTGAVRALVVQLNSGTAGTAGIDKIQISRDGGKEWVEDETLLALASDDATGTILANGLLNAAGVEPAGAAIFKGGPYEGPVLMRVVRDATVDAESAAWVTGAPAVMGIRIG